MDNVPVPVAIFGDLHGRFDALIRWVGRIVFSRYHCICFSDTSNWLHPICWNLERPESISFSLATTLMCVFKQSPQISNSKISARKFWTGNRCLADLPQTSLPGTNHHSSRQPRMFWRKQEVGLLCVFLRRNILFPYRYGFYAEVLAKRNGNYQILRVCFFARRPT